MSAPGTPTDPTPTRGWLEMLKPLRRRDFALLWSGGTISMLGDGIYLVAIAWQVYDLSNVPTALSVVGVAWSIGIVTFLLLGGVLSDRIDRRKVIIGSDLARFTVLLAMGVLSVSGNLELWMVVILALLFGSAEAFFGPAWTAIVADIVPEEELVAANSLEHTIQPIALRLVGPLLGGVLIATASVGTALIIDSTTFLVSAACVAALRVRPARKEPVTTTIRADLREAAVFVRGNTWLWATLIAASIAILAFWGPEEVLVPFVIRNDLHGSAGDFAFVLAGQGIGSVIGSFAMARAGMPRRPITFMFFAWGLATIPAGAYLFVNQVWQPVFIAMLFGVGMSVGMVVWTTLMQSRVPAELRGRVNSLDWFASLGLVPISFALTGPAAALFGSTATLVGAGVGSGLFIIVMLFAVPGLRGEDARLTAAAEDAAAQAGVGSGPVLTPASPAPPLDETAWSGTEALTSGTSVSTGDSMPTDA